MSIFNSVKLNARVEEVEFDFGPILTGLTKLQPVVVNPNLATLQQMGYNYNEEPTYIRDDERTVGNQKVKVKVTSLTIYCKVTSEIQGLEGELPEQFYIPVTFRLGARHVKSSTGLMQVINAYGQCAYVNESEFRLLTSGQKMSDDKAWYLPKDVRLAYEGEEQLISFIRSFRNLPLITGKTKPENIVESFFPKEVMDAIIALHPDTNAYFNGLFAEKHPETGEGYSVTFLLGARTNDKGYLVQDVYTRSIYRNYLTNKPNSAATNFVKKEVQESQQASHKSNTDFQLFDLTCKVYNAEAQGTAVADKNDLFGASEFDNLNMPNTGMADPLAGLAQQQPVQQQAVAQQGFQQQAPQQNFQQQAVPQQNQGFAQQAVPQQQQGFDASNPLASMGQPVQTQQQQQQAPQQQGFGGIPAAGNELDSFLN